MEDFDKDWYTYLTEDFKLDRKMYKSKDFAVVDCPKCGKALNERVDKLKWKVKELGYYECHPCRRTQSILRARDKFKEKYGDINPFQLEESKSKIKETMIKNHGVDCILKKPEIHAKGIAKAKELRDRVRHYDYDFSNISCKSKDNIQTWNTEYFNIRRKLDPRFIPTVMIKGALCRMMKNSIKPRSKSKILKQLGYTPDQLRSHIESKFLPGMTWENHGKWHLDHIIPISAFDCSKLDQLILANQLENLQPLWAGDNIRKSNKY